ncbi:MAG TPA: ribonucleoside-diphosphate reductase subunit alpha, partial [Acidimicrobiales bacterium]|nr:ribonucleoside-diphosphate reductase subunit alpha [Acidimicrobiales bacterium]
SLEPVDVNKIVRAVARCAEGLEGVDPLRVATRTISALCDGATTRELDELSIRTAAGLVAEEPAYSRLAARLLLAYIGEEVRRLGIASFSQSVEAGARLGLVAPGVARLVADHRRRLDGAVDPTADDHFELFGLRTVYDRYLLRHPDERTVIETPQYFLLRVACGLAAGADEAIALYRHMAHFDYLPSSPTLFNSGTAHPQLSSCYLLDSPADDLAAIYRAYGDVAALSKFAGGIGIAFSRVRSRGSLIRGTNGVSNGVVPFLKALDASVAAVNQGGRRKGACCAYLETWHADIEEFLELRDNTGDEARRAHNLNIANWVPDLFMQRVENDWMWSLFDPKEVPELCNLHGDAFAEAYQRAEEGGRAVRQVRARELYGRMMRTLAETGNGWMAFKDAANRTCNQAGEPGNVVHLSNLCTEILEVTDAEHTAVCNLGSLNLGRFVDGDAFDLARLGSVVKAVVPFLDRVIDANYYPTEAARRSNLGWRPVGLGVMGLQDVFFRLRLPFAGDGARRLSRLIAEEVYASALEASADLAAAVGPHPRYHETHAARGRLQPDLWGVAPSDPERWASLRARIAEVGLRNSLLVAVAPTATIASIAGCYECIEPQVSNLFKRETLSGEFLQVNAHLVRDLQRLGLWNEATRGRLVADNGSVQGIPGLPDDVKELYRTAWEIPMRALIDMAADRGPFIDQSQSLNLFVEQPTIGRLSSMYLHAWKRGLKTTYYLRSRPASRITTTSAPAAGTRDDDGAAMACALERPGSCEACD